jgi:outer membrane protein OmpA-like peptidoglycan-associated protein
VTLNTTFSRANPWLVRLFWIALTLAAMTAQAQDRGRDPARIALLRNGMELAKNDGAKGQLPTTWWGLEFRLDEAEKNGATPQQWSAMETDVKRLQSGAAFVARMRQQKSGMEALLGRFDQSLHEIGALYGVAPDPTLSGTAAAEDLLRRLSQTNLARQGRIDSLTVANRRLNDTVQTTVVYQDSMLTALRVQVSSLRQKLWETELRAGVAEADRSAAESVLTTKQQRDEAIAGLRDSFGQDEGEITLKPDGTIVMRLHGVSFGIGSAELQPGQEQLLTKVSAAVGRFPGSAIRVEGHTDDSGGREANLRLSRRRAETVARRLEQDLQLEAESVMTEGYGPDRPVALNSTPEGRARNRRIDIVISGGQ